MPSTPQRPPESRELPELTTEAQPILCPSRLEGLRADAPVCRVRTPAGDEAWLVTRHAEAKRLMNDQRVDRYHPDPAAAPRYIRNPLVEMLIGDDLEDTRAGRARTRSLLTPNFTTRRMERLRPKVEALASAMVEDLAARERPVDLRANFSLPFSLRVICELIGVPEDDWQRCATLLAQIGQTDPEDGTSTGPEALFKLLGEVATYRRQEPGEDVLSHLCGAGIPDEHAGMLTGGVLFAGLDSVANHIDLGVVLLSSNPDQRDAVTRDPAVLGGVVEEVLRSSKRAGATLPRYANEDIEIDDVTIRAGDLVLLDFGLANFDERAFDDPEEFDVTRSPNRHLSFGHGMWHCTGAPLARMELSTAFSVLFSRLPELRPAVPVNELRTQGGTMIGVLAELPVTW
ncbi:cytochrome P450 [Streptomyces sp. NPDC088400]|uniref:cytochrome P450 n=1 Tax=Streptomyces sp. NPDC088400 TaxID=3365861 RepID=UPI0037FE8CDA